MKNFLTFLCLSLAIGAVHASSGQLQATKLIALIKVDTIPDDSNCKEQIRALEEERERLEKEFWDIDSELSDLYWTCPSDSSNMTGYRSAVGTMFTGTESFALNYSDADESPYFDGMLRNWAIQWGLSVDPFEANRRYVGMLIGFELDYSRINSAQRLEAVDGAVSFAAVDTTSVYKSNAMHLGFVKFPIMGRIGKYSEWSSGSVQFCVGIVPGIRYLGAITTRRSNGASATSEITRNLGLRRCSLNSRIAVSAKNVELFMESSLLSLFKEDAANPVVYPTTFGIALSVMGY